MYLDFSSHFLFSSHHSLLNLFQAVASLIHFTYRIVPYSCMHLQTLRTATRLITPLFLCNISSFFILIIYIFLTHGHRSSSRHKNERTRSKQHWTPNCTLLFIRLRRRVTIDKCPAEDHASPRELRLPEMRIMMRGG